MNKYELLVLFAEDQSEADQKQLVEAIKDQIEKNKGILKNSESWGKKSLAFQIGQSKSGFYWLLNFEGEEQTPKKINDSLRIEAAVLRFILTKDDKPAVVKKPLKKVAVETAAPKKKLTETFIR